MKGETIVCSDLCLYNFRPIRESSSALFAGNVDVYGGHFPMVTVRKMREQKQKSSILVLQ